MLIQLLLLTIIYSLYLFIVVNYPFTNLILYAMHMSWHYVCYSNMYAMLSKLSSVKTIDIGSIFCYYGDGESGGLLTC